MSRGYSHEQALEIVHQHLPGWTPQTPYPGTNDAPWPGWCGEHPDTATAGTFASMRSGSTPCPLCKSARISAARLAYTAEQALHIVTTLHPNWQPTQPYPGNASQPWEGTCIDHPGERTRGSLVTMKRGSQPCRQCHRASLSRKRRESQASGTRKKRTRRTHTQALAEVQEHFPSWTPLGSYPGKTSAPWPGTCAEHPDIPTATTFLSMSKGRQPCLACRSDAISQRRRLTHEQALQRAHEHFPGWTPIGDYPQRNDRIWPGRCASCGSITRGTLASMASGRDPCRTCVPLAYTHLQALELVHQQWPNWTPLEPYPGARRNWNGTCGIPTCGAVTTMPFQHMQTGLHEPCPACAARASSTRQRTSHTDALRKAEQYAPDFQPNVEFPGVDHPWPGICFRCHNPVSPTLYRMSIGRGHCGYCNNTVKDTSLLIGRMMAKDLLPLQEYPGMLSRWKCRCLRCGAESYPMAANLVSGINLYYGQGGCSSCSEGGGYKPSATGSFYLLAGNSLIKGGISNHPRKRLAQHARQGLTDIIALAEFANGWDAVEVESLWMEFLSMQPADCAATRTELPDGFTEATHDTVPVRRWVDTELLPLITSEIVSNPETWVSRTHD